MKKLRPMAERDPNTCTSCGTPLDPLPIPDDMTIRELRNGRVVRVKIPGATFAPYRWCAPCEVKNAERAEFHRQEDARALQAWGERVYDALAGLGREAAVAALVAERRALEVEW